MTFDEISKMKKSEREKILNAQFAAVMLQYYLENLDTLDNNGTAPKYFIAGCNTFDHFSARIAEREAINRVTAGGMVFHTLLNALDDRPRIKINIRLITYHAICGSAFLDDTDVAARYINAHAESAADLFNIFEMTHTTRLRAVMVHEAALKLCEVVPLPVYLGSFLAYMGYGEAVTDKRPIEYDDLLKLGYIYGVRAERARRRREPAPRFPNFPKV